MSCPSSELLSRFVADGLDLDIAAHLATCDACSAEVEAHRAVSDDVHLLPVYEPSPAQVRDVRAALLAAARIPAPTPVVSIASRRTILVAAAVLAAAAVALLVIRPLASHHDVTAVYRSTIHPHDGAQFIRVGGSPDEIVRLTRGTITVEVATLDAKERFRVITDDSEVEVRGTAFDVTASNDRLSAVHVLHGTVEVRTTGSQPLFLGDGQRWQPTLARTDNVLEPTAGPGSAAGSDVSATTASGEEPARDSRPTHGNKKHATSIATRDDVKSSTTAKIATNSNAASDVKSSTTATETPATSQTAATQQIQTSHVQSQLGSAKRANEVEFDKGWQAMNGGNFASAATAFEQAAKAAPNDPLAEDAWFWRASALTRAKSSSAASALDAFISRYPHSPRAGEASAMLGWLLLDRDPDRAEKLFTAASNDRVATVAASGTKGLAAVAQKRSNAK